MAADRPLVFVDLDDTLFQTARKMTPGTPRYPATLDVHGQPNGYMSATQKIFIDWLLASADVVPVTARSVEAYRRVQLPFNRGAICSHGAVLLAPEGQADPDWAARMTEVLTGYQTRLAVLSTTTLAMGKALGIALRSWVVEDQNLNHYVVVKHNGGEDAVLRTVLAEVRARGLLDGMHCHINGNNLAFLPDDLNKRVAVQEWLRRDRADNGERPVLGLGDSLTDLGFMSECHIWATPSGSQLATQVLGVING